MSAEAQAPAAARVQTPTARLLGWGFVALSAATFALIVLGALVRAHGAGLACPDWPLCFGQVFPEFDMQIAFEWGHRVLAGGVSIGLAILTAMLWRRPDLRAGGAPILGAAWALLMVQVVLGGLTVLLLLAPWTVTAHLLTGTTFCALLVWIARDLLEWGREPPRVAAPRGVVLWACLSAGGLVLQLVLGGLVSSQAAGLACADFPTCDGRTFVPTLKGLVGLHVLHRLNGFLLIGLFGALSWTARGSGPVGLLAWTALRLLIFQIGVGVLNVLLRLPVEVTGLHTGFAAAMMMLMGLLLRELAYSPAASAPSVPSESSESSGSQGGEAA